MNTSLQLVINTRGMGHCIYDELIDLARLGQLHIERASHCEPDADGNWHCNLNPVNGPQLGPFSSRSAALAAEQKWLTERWLPIRYE